MIRLILVLRWLPCLLALLFWARVIQAKVLKLLLLSLQCFFQNERILFVLGSMQFYTQTLIHVNNSFITNACELHGFSLIHDVVLFMFSHLYRMTKWIKHITSLVIIVFLIELNAFLNLLILDLGVSCILNYFSENMHILVFSYFFKQLS